MRKEALKEAILANSFTTSEALEMEMHGESCHQNGEPCCIVPSVPSPPVSPPHEHQLDEAHSEPLPIPEPEWRILKLLIEDVREQPVNKFIQDVAVRSAHDLETGQWLVNGNDLLKALQDSPAALGGQFRSTLK